MLRIIVISALLFGIPPGFAQQKTMLHHVAPDFTLKGLDRQSVRLSDYKGKIILLDFWATWCTPCQTELPRFAEFQRRYGAQRLQVIAVSMDDSPNPVRDFYNKFKLNYPVAMGNAQVANAYGGILGLPMTFLIGTDGRVLKQYDGGADLDQMERDIREQLSSIADQKTK